MVSLCGMLTVRRDRLFRGLFWSVRLLTLSLLVLIVPVVARAVDAPPASPLLPPDHWAVKVADRLEELGLVDHHLPAQRAVPILVVRRALAEAERRAGLARPDLLPLIKAWRERFDEQWSGAKGGSDGPRLLGAQLEAGYQLGSAHEAPLKSPGPADGLLLEAPRTDPFARADAAAAWGEHFAAGASVHGTPWQANLPSVEVVGALGPVALSVGKTAVGYGPNEVGAVTASGEAPIERMEFMTTVPVRLPGVLRVLGDASFDTVLARFDEARHPNHPLLWELDVQVRPHPRFTLGAIRGYMFDPVWQGSSTIPSLIGVSNSAPGNNVYSISARYRLPTERLLPLTAKVEWGTDDNPGAAVQWPGLVAGISAPMLPFVPASLGFEYAYFGKGPFGYHDPFSWYSHTYAGDNLGWATQQTPLGDPLGGNGRAFRLTASMDPFDARLHLAGMGWVQDRFDDAVNPPNLYSPGAGGWSVGASGEAEVRLGRAALGLNGRYEHGMDGWSQKQIEAAAKVFF